MRFPNEVVCYNIWYITTDRDLIIVGSVTAANPKEALDEWCKGHPGMLRKMMVVIPMNAQVHKEIR